MTQENKELLLKDLCVRTPYELVGKCEIDASYDTYFDTKFQTHKFNAVLYGIKEDSVFVTPLVEDIDEQNFANEEVTDGVDIFRFYALPIPSFKYDRGTKNKNISTLQKDGCMTHLIQ